MVKTNGNENMEILLLMNFVGDEALDVPHNVKKLLNGEYLDIINNELKPSILGSFRLTDDFKKAIFDKIKEDEDSRMSWLCLGVAALLQFVECNWTGPQLEEEIDWLVNRRNEALKILSLNDECNENVVKPELLYLSKIIFSNDDLLDTYNSIVWWLFRANYLHQQLLEENCGILYEESEKLLLDISNLKILSNSYCRTLFHLEAAQFYFLYRRTQNSEKHLEAAQSTAELKLNLQAALGKRTKYQQEEKAQLFLQVETGKELFPFKICQELPKSLDLNDDVRLEFIEFSEKMEQAPLGSMEEAVVLSKYFQLQLSQPRDNLMIEEIEPYLNYVINNTRDWSLKVSSLYQRCNLESNHKRTIERSMLQVEYLIQESQNPKVPITNKMNLFFPSGMKPTWVLEETWADIMSSTGMIKGALNIYLKLKLWGKVITCYNILQLKHKAAEIIEQEIAKKPTVNLYCLLGDATQEVCHYETAWKLSQEKSSKVQRHWGNYYFEKKNYIEAVPHLKLSSELNNLQENVWLRLGFAALQLEDWKLGAMAYRRYCTLDETSFEAWNNLAKAYIKLGNKPRAWKCLEEAVKCNYDKWEVWDNLMAVSTDLGHFSEVIRCYHRILDLKNQHLDVQILNIITRAIVGDINDSSGEPSMKYLKKTLELFGRISASMPSNADFWQLYAQLTSLKKTDLDDQKSAQYLQQAHRVAVSDPQWFKKEESTLHVLDLCYNLAEIYLRCSAEVSSGRKKSMLGSAKLSLQGVVKKIKDQQLPGENVTEKLKKVEDRLRIIVEELGKL